MLQCRRSPEGPRRTGNQTAGRERSH
ncbi:hypothetical protein CBM2586_A10618 [Cupriavidus phytorum]|uniref:Uncharacterized protein n=1 Tax=Cupriavidus taiwanensis TaxID=164546 RepID=A0A975WQ62_9BURK|nr:hypothetical protein CBM2586_A10618 [Cupriavidus taiwanensis]